MADEAKIRFADKLDGKPLRTDDSSMLGRIFALVSKPAVQNGEVLPLIFQALDINSAEKQQLDNLLWNIHRIKRKDSGQANGLVILHLSLGTFIASGSEVGNAITGDSYRIDSNVTSSNIDVNGVDLEITALSDEYKLKYTIDGYLSTSPEITIKRGSGDTTIRAVADRIVDAVNNQSSYLTATRNNDNTVKVIVTDQSMIGTFIVTGGDMTVQGTYSPVYVTSTTYTSQESTANQITNIKTSAYGWLGVTNPFPISASTPIEGDEDYRYRGKLELQKSSGKYNNIIMALKSVKGVVYQSVQQNTSINPTNNQIINNGVAINVLGGNEDDIALAIFESISEGTGISGSITKTVNDINGVGVPIKFSRPLSKAVTISMRLITNPDFPINGKAQIKDAIVSWFNDLNVGEDIHYSRLYVPINSIRGFGVRDLKIGYKGGSLSTDDLIISYNELATISAEDILIGGS